MRELQELVEANIITLEKAEEIKHYFAQKKSKPDNRLTIVFGILGALLVGLGIILIIAHNWDDLNKVTKLFIAFLPLAVGQVICAFSIFKRPNSVAWREASSTFLFFAIASSISIVSQVYNIHGNLGRFLLVWMLLSLPIIYTSRSSVASLLYWIGITWYACEVSYFQYPQQTAYYYWLLVAAAITHYWRLMVSSATSNFTIFHHWLIPLGLTISIGMFGRDADGLMVVCYLILFSIFVSIAQCDFLSGRKIISNGYLVIGSLGTIALSLFLTFNTYWDWISKDNSTWGKSEASIVLIVLVLIATVLMFVLLRNKQWHQLKIKSYTYIFFVLLAIVGSGLPALAQILANLAVLALAVFIMRDGAEKESLGLLNYGLLTIAALIACRFFDTELSFVLRGLLFIGLGVAFFAANYWLIQKKKQKKG